MNFKLGCNESRHDPRTLMLGAFLAPGTVLPAPPPNIDWGVKAQDKYILGHNDAYGDCVAVASLNACIDHASNTNDPYSLTDDDAVKVYSAVGGFDPATGANDNGLQPIDMLKWWAKNPINGISLLAYAQVDQTNITQVRQTVSIFGGAFTALALPKTAQRQVGSLWDVAPFWMPGRTAGSWGLHMVWADSYDASQAAPARYNCETWKTRQPITEAFLKKYGLEIWAIVTDLWLDAQDKKSPGGLDLSGLLAASAALKNA